MLIVNADDYGRSRAETDAVLSCHRAGRITSATAMVFMQDSARGAELANEAGIDVGLHLNLSERFTAPDVNSQLATAHERVIEFLTTSKFAVLAYHPFLRREFRRVVEAQFEEFVRVYGRWPSHVDGHRHHHLCSNLLFQGLIPAGCRVRPSFSFVAGEKSLLNRGYRRAVNLWLARRYEVVDFFFSLEQCLGAGGMSRVLGLAETARVELMAHPLNQVEFAYLMSDDYHCAVRLLNNGVGR